MQEEKSRESSSHGEKKADRFGEATSDETLSDVESSEQTATKKNDSTSKAEGASSVTPDSVSGSDRRGRADGSDTGGPM